MTTCAAKLTEGRDLKANCALKKIDNPVDMVKVFRPQEKFCSFAEKTIAFGTKVLCGEFGIYDDRAAKLSEDAGVQVVKNHYPKVDLVRSFWKPRLDLAI